MTAPAQAKAAATRDALALSPNTASIRRRLAAMLYESLLLLGVLSLTFMVPQLLIGAIWHTTAPGTVLWLHVFLVLMAYFLWFWRRSGQTLAMQTWKLRLIAAEAGGLISRRQAFARYALAWPSVLLGGIGILWALFDRDRQFLHDRLAGTRLVRTP